MSRPKDLVPLYLDKVRGVRPQEEIEREARRLRAFAVGEGNLWNTVENALLKGRVVFQRNSGEAIRINNDTGDTQFMYGMQAGINPFFAGGTDLDADGNGYTLKLFALRGDAYFNGLMSTANVDISKWYCGCHHSPGLTTLETYGMPAWTVDGTITSADSSSNSWASFTTAATTNDDKGINGDLRFRTDQGFEHLYRIATGPDITSLRIWVGAFASDPAATNTPLQNFIGYRFAAGTDTNWACYTGDGAARTNTDSGVVVTANTSYYLRLRVSASEAIHSLGMPNVGAGTQNFTTTTTLPTITALMAPYVRVTALSNSARSLLFGTANFLSR